MILCLGGCGVAVESTRDYCKPCAAKRKQTPCAGRCGCTLLAQYQFCQGCRPVSGAPVPETTDRPPLTSKRQTTFQKPRSAKALKEAEAYLTMRGQPIPWKDNHHEQ